MYQRPSTLHGLKHKLHTSCATGQSSICATGGTVKTLHTSNSANSLPNRRKSVGHIPLSPLARTPSPSPLPSSPTRSPSPLAFPLVGHQPGSSNTTQSYSPGGTLPTTQAVVTAGKKGGFARTKSVEPSSPLLRRALSPDRLHPRSAEAKCTLISPLCCSPPIKLQQQTPSTQRVIGGVWRSTIQSSTNNTSTAVALPPINPNINTTNPQQSGQEIVSTATAEISYADNANPNASTLGLPAPGEMLPRIAEEKDSPTSSTHETGFMQTIDENDGEATTVATTSIESNKLETSMQNQATNTSANEPQDNGMYETFKI